MIQVNNLSYFLYLRYSSLKHKIKNTVIINELNIFNLDDGMQNFRSDWNDHIERMEPEQLGTQSLDT
jgi:hypothetical protein